jgi:hypothetical protein
MRRSLIIVGCVLAACCGSASARQGPVPGTGVNRGMVANPYAPMNPWPGASNGNQAFLFFLSSQYQAARRARAEATPMPEPSLPRSSPQFRMQPGGSSASGYFGRTSPMRPQAGPVAPARYNRLGGHFGDRGR